MVGSRARQVRALALATSCSDYCLSQLTVRAEQPAAPTCPWGSAATRQSAGPSDLGRCLLVPLTRRGLRILCLRAVGADVRCGDPHVRPGDHLTPLQSQTGNRVCVCVGARGPCTAGRAAVDGAGGLSTCRDTQVLHGPWSRLPPFSVASWSCVHVDLAGFRTAFCSGHELGTACRLLAAAAPEGSARFGPDSSVNSRLAAYLYDSLRWRAIPGVWSDSPLLLP